jgi:hypothetical protein
LSGHAQPPAARIYSAIIFLFMNRQSVLSEFESLLPLAIQWANEREKYVLGCGVGLTADEVEDALALGVGDPGRVRLLSVKVIDRPNDPALRAACDAIDFLTPATRGLTLGHGILIREDCWRDRALIAHELSHVSQYERFGGIEPFLKQYLTECLTVGYAESELEKEAITAASRIYP